MKARTLILVCLAAICLVVAFIGYHSVHSHPAGDGLTVPADNSPATNGTSATVPASSASSGQSK
jgi:hypothetical protein